MSEDRIGACESDLEAAREALQVAVAGLRFSPVKPPGTMFLTLEQVAGQAVEAFRGRVLEPAEAARLKAVKKARKRLASAQKILEQARSAQAALLLQHERAGPEPLPPLSPRMQAWADKAAANDRWRQR